MRIRPDAQPFLRRSLAVLSALAQDATGNGKDKVEGRIFAQWLKDGTPKLRLIASDGRRACRITLPGDEFVPVGEATFKLPAIDTPARKQESHTIFKAENGAVRLIGGHTQETVFGVEFESADSYPEMVNDMIDDARRLDATTAAVRLELNPEFVADALAIVTGFWAQLPDALVEKDKPRFTWVMPGHKHEPLFLEASPGSQVPPFKIEYLLMPYRSP